MNLSSPVNRTEKPLVYLILGAAGSGRRAVLLDLIEGGLAETDRAAVMLPEGEPANATLEEKLPGVTRWQWHDGIIGGTLPADATHVFFVTDGTRDPIDLIEVFMPWVEAQRGESARVLCVVTSQLAEKNPSLFVWFEACVHFADVVLVNTREGVENKWITDFLNHFKKLYYP